MIYKNLNSKKIKGSYILMVSCGICKTDIVEYQKVGKGRLLRLYIDRIIKGSIDFSKDLVCPKCENKLGDKIVMKKRDKKAYRMIRGRYNTRQINY